MKIITYQEAEKILGVRVDRRKKYHFEESPEAKDMFGEGPVYTYEEWTTNCSGCTESEMGHYTCGSAQKGAGCRECGYTGKRRDGWYSSAEALKEVTNFYIQKHQ